MTRTISQKPKTLVQEAHAGRRLLNAVHKSIFGFVIKHHYRSRFLPKRRFLRRDPLRQLDPVTAIELVDDPIGRAPWTGAGRI
jgi:hypothetical protein